MPIDLTGESISDVYSSFLHLSTNALTTTPQQVADGIGNLAPVLLSTEGIALSGSVSINSYQFPSAVGTQYQMLRVDGSGDLEYAGVLDTLLLEKDITLPVDGRYSNPVITIEEGIVTSIQNNPAIKTFFIRKGSPVTSDYIDAIVVDWPYPVMGDIAFVHNLETNNVYRAEYTGASITGWEIQTTI